ncbi:MAG: hypothetical protein JSV80_15945, partial [Acidobacteriota bacterium]
MSASSSSPSSGNQSSVGQSTGGRTSGKRSRLEPELVPRRDFLGRSAAWSAAGALLFALFGMLRLPKAAVLPAPSKKVRVALPES